MQSTTSKIVIPDQLKPYTRAPRIAWPTLALFLLASVTYFFSTSAGIQGWLPAWAAVLINALAVFWFFTVVHDACHNALSKIRPLNNLIGRLAIVPFSVLPVYRAFRFIHMQHHRFTNHTDGSDPDFYCGNGPRWQLPLRWATLDIKYYIWYMARLGERPKGEVIDTFVTIGISVSLTALLVSLGYGQELLLYWFLPSRIAIPVLGYAFDYLPHSPYKATQSENPWQATNNRVGMEKVMTPLLLSQNYHLVHHLYPLAPFYRYLKLWRLAEQYHLDNKPLLVTLTGKEISSLP